MNKKISIVIPVYNEEENIRSLYQIIKNILICLNDDYEIIFIDDGSKDKTYETLKETKAKDTHIKIIKLAKNYGQLYAILAGFEFAKGDIIITMDGDLQNDPYDIPKFLAKMNDGFDLISGWRCGRNDPLSRKLISKTFNWLIIRRTGIALHDYGCALTATRKELIDRLKSYGRNARFIKPLLANLANSVAEIKVSHYPRKAGKSKYNLVKIIKSGLDFLFNFTIEPKGRNNLSCNINIEEIIGS